MSARVIRIAEWKAKREAEIIRSHMLGPGGDLPRRPTLSELMGWPPLPPSGGRAA